LCYYKKSGRKHHAYDEYVNIGLSPESTEVRKMITLLQITDTPVSVPQIIAVGGVAGLIFLGKLVGAPLIALSAILWLHGLSS